MGKICSLGTEFPVSSQTLHSDRGIGLLHFDTPCKQHASMGMHRLQQEWTTKKVRKQKREANLSQTWRKGICLLWTQETWKCLALQNMLPVGRENTGVRSSNKPWGRTSQLLGVFWHEGRKAQQNEIYGHFIRKTYSSITGLWIGRNPRGNCSTNIGLTYEPQAWATY